MNIQPHQLGVRVKGSDEILAADLIDYNKKTITYTLFGRAITVSFDDAQLVVCEN